MKHLFKTAAAFLLVAILLSCTLPTSEQSAENINRAIKSSTSAGADYVDSDTAMIWLTDTSIEWADIHYSINSGAQLNIRMQKSGYTFSYTVDNLSLNDIVSYWFTIGYTDGAQDTETYKYTHVQSTSTSSDSFTVEAEDYEYMSGIQTETCSEGGLNVGWIDAGDWIAYPSRYFSGGTYTIEYRVASLSGGGKISADLDAGTIPLGVIDIPSTGGWQNWTTVTQQVSIPEGEHSFGIYVPAGGYNINWIRFTPDSTTVPTPTPTGGVDTNPAFIDLKSGMEMTIQFDNKTNGQITNDRIYIAVIGRDNTDRWTYLKPDGSTVAINAGENSENWFFRLDTINGFQVPTVYTSVRLYMSIDVPLNMSAVTDATGNVGIVQPNLANPSDPNQNIIFDWAEFTVHSGTFWGNTTQVDQFGFPYTLAVYSDNGTLAKKTGIELGREEVFSRFSSYVPSEFTSLVKYPYRILAPGKGDFGEDGIYANYFDSYVDQVWQQYKTQTLYVSHPLGDFEARVLSDDRMEFTRTSDGQKFYISGKPNDTEILEGSGVLASGNTVELALEAWVCAAFNRHVMHYPSSSYWNNPSYYYQSGPANWYSAFWHSISLGGFAYGFCYDDVNDQSTLIEAHSVRAAVIEIFW
ncbi:beta-1,3-glucanase family protein [Spirochaetia bacterium 38H-sp]|uniref:Beta-1,3-glucanase family protein n=1 Tax=Rarispira pelagica TaxID=3141764 RepID=A0ABU9UA92_9SPIR